MALSLENDDFAFNILFARSSIKQITYVRIVGLCYKKNETASKIYYLLPSPGKDTVLSDRL